MWKGNGVILFADEQIIEYAAYVSSRIGRK